ncbi:hypothetical protein Tco_1561576 [Tanacetum coccineum]
MSSSSFNQSYRYQVIPKTCKCDLPLLELVSWTPTNPARRFMKNRVKKCKKFYWKDLELESDWYRSHMREMYLILNPIERGDLETEIRSRDALATMEVEDALAIMEVDEKKISFFKAVVFVLIVAFGVVLDYESMVWILKVCYYLLQSHFYTDEQMPNARHQV